jgi:predicted porin
MSLPLNGQDLTLMGVAGDVDVNDRLNLDASYAKLEFNGQDLDLALLGATYGVTQTIDVYGNVGQLSGGGDSITLARLGAEYAFNDRVSAFAELQRLDIQAVSFPSMDGTGISLGLKVDLGAKPNSHKSSIERLNDTVSAYTLDWF